MTWTRSSTKPPSSIPRTQRQIAQQDWLTTKGMALCARQTMLAALARVPNFSAYSREYYKEQTAATCYYICQAADAKWEEAQLKYPKKIRRKKNETITSS